MRRLRLWVACLGLLLATPGTAAALPRATADRPDDIFGLQVHMIYAVAADAVDRGLDTDGSVQNAVDSFQQWLATQTGGRTLRMDTYQGSVDVTFRRVAALDGQEQPEPPYPLVGVENDLAQAGLLTPTKVYGVYYDGGSSANGCGNANWPMWPQQPAVRTVAAFYLHGMGGGCFHGFPSASDPPNYTVFAMFHDVLHTLGMVGTCAPHHNASNPGHVQDSNSDLMYGGPLPWYPSVLDVGRDDYFRAGIPGCVDLDTVGFLTSPTTSELTVGVAGTAGEVVSTPWPLLDCPPVCAASYGTGTVVALDPRPGANSAFAGWSGACSGSGPCLVTLDQAHSVTATFARPKRTLTASALGTGLGTITSEPAGVSCPPTCTATFTDGTSATLTATAAPGSDFVGWSRDCTGGDCRLTLDSDKSVEGVFVDAQSPRTQALASQGRRGGIARLRYRVDENMGMARAVGRIYGPIRRAKAVASTGLRRVAANKIYTLRWKVPRSLRAKRLRFCVHAIDASALSGKASCARLTLG